MLQLHTHNLQTEIAEYQYSMQTDSLLPTMDDTQNVTQDVTQTDNTTHPTSSITASGTSSNTQDQTSDNTTNDISNDTSDDTASRLLTPRQRQILQMMQTDGSVSASTMAMRLGFTVRTIRRDIETLRKHYTIRWIGSSKQGHWQILPQNVEQ